MLPSYILTFFLLLGPCSINAGRNFKEPQVWKTKTKFINFNPTEKKKIFRALQLIKRVVSSEEFRKKIISYTQNGSNRFVDHQGLENQEIYQKIIQGAELLGTKSINYQMDLELELYHQSSQTIGYTYPDSRRVWINKKYFNRYNTAQIANNLMHEWLHKLGFTHSYEWNQFRDHSIPYAVGRLVEEMILKEEIKF